MVRETELLTIVRRRESLLRRLAAGPTRPCTLTAELELSRSTIDRGISELQRAELIERTTVDGQCQYRLTVAGDLALSSFEQLSDRLTQVTRRSELLAELPPSADLSWQIIDGATAVTPSTPPAQVADSLSIGGVLELPECDGGVGTERTNAEANTLEATLSVLLRLGKTHQVVVPGATHCLASAYCGALGDAESGETKREPKSGIEVTVIAPDDAIQSLLGAFGDGTASALSAGQLVLRETTQPPPYGLVCVELAEETVETEATALTILLVCGADDEPCGLLVGDDQAACEWARTRIASIAETAQRLSAPTE
ncbi:hypothetical protein C482_10516 [Natrialba chahannaoensis JCM 10990]|uniref:HTH arsR-type domain-containing protein n=1 Tax=Natrialba chahannaoensis JCM 10990 TaxID=1227492 RepID=M0ANM7_9EURY|nr:hypothetical protein [Natrialba chahannaoensis]ELY98983.1 hypothetical protein C482_10516 [Natrialba chahannaoensis JCM 10990]